MAGAASRENGKKGGRPRKHRDVPVQVSAMQETATRKPPAAGIGRTAGIPNKVNRKLREYADQYTEEAVDGLAGIARNEENPASARVSAYAELLDRGHGRPPSSQHVTADIPFLHNSTFIFLVQQQPGAENRT